MIPFLVFVPANNETAVFAIQTPPKYSEFRSWRAVEGSLYPLPSAETTGVNYRLYFKTLLYFRYAPVMERHTLRRRKKRSENIK